VDETGFIHLRGSYRSIYGWGSTQISFLEAGTHFLKVFNMSATMARQAGWVQLEQSDMRLASDMARMATGGFSCAGIEEPQYLVTQLHTEVQEETKRGVEFPGNRKVKDALEKDPAMHHENHTDGSLPCPNGNVMNLQTHWRRNGTASTPDWHRWPTPEQMPPMPGSPPVPPSGNAGAQCS